MALFLLGDHILRLVVSNVTVAEINVSAKSDLERSEVH